jgi:WD40 repeat protein
MDWLISLLQDVAKTIASKTILLLLATGAALLLAASLQRWWGRQLPTRKIIRSMILFAPLVLAIFTALLLRPAHKAGEGSFLAAQSAHGDAISDLVIAKSRIFSTSYDGSIHVLDLESGALMHRYKLPEGMFAKRVLPGENGEIKTVVGIGHSLPPAQGNGNPAPPAGTIYHTSCEDGAACKITAASGEADVLAAYKGMQNRVTSATVTGWHGWLLQQDNAKPYNPPGVTGPLHIGEKELAFGLPDGKVQIGSQVLDGHTGPVTVLTGSVRLAWSDGASSALVSAGADGRVLFWRVDRQGTYEKLSFGEGGNACPSCRWASLAGDGMRLLTAGATGRVTIWDTVSQKALVNIDHGASVNVALFVPGHASCVTAGDDGTAKLWELTTSTNGTVSAALAAVIRGHGHMITHMELSPDGRKLVTGDAYGDVIVTDLDTARRAHWLDIHSAYDQSLNPLFAQAMASVNSLKQLLARVSERAGSNPEALTKKLPPVIAILSPNDGSTFSSDRLSLRYSLRSPSGQAISEIRVLVNGRPLTTLEPPRGVGETSEPDANEILTGLPQNDLTLSLIARAGDLESTSASVQLKFHGATQAPADTAAQNASTVSLYALVVGVSRFKDKRIVPLEWAAKDANDFAAALKRQQGRLYRKVEVKLLADEDADNASILDGLTWLQRQVSPGDVGLLFLAGHGATDPAGNYYYVSYNAKIQTVAGLQLPTRSSSVPDTEIRQVLKQLAGSAIFFFDTCHSAKASGVSFGGLDYNKGINEIADAANAIVLAGCASSELSLESEEWRNGAFTKALIEGMEGRGLHYNPSIVTLDELTLYVKERVKELTKGLQHPVDLKPKEARDIPFAMP